ncbi:MAG: hypothetical protein ACYC41_02585 [Bacillota bacterium]
MRALAYTLIYLLVIQLVLGLVVPVGLVYHYRLDFNVVKNSPAADYDVVLDQVGREIKREKLTDYLVILGDSVGYSGPGGSEQSLGYYLEDISKAQGRPMRVFNLSMPAMQAGDIYTADLKLREHGISDRHVAVNFIYGGFVARNPDPPAATWFQDDLRRLDPEAYAYAVPSLKANGRIKPSGYADWFRRVIYPRVPILRYRDFLRAAIDRHIPGSGPDEVADTRPWSDKPGLPQLLQAHEYQRLFDDTPFVMDESNPQVYFFDRLIARAQADGSDLTFFQTPANPELMKANVAKPGYAANLRRITEYFAAKPTRFIDLEGQISPRLFADHLHLVPEGYRQMAGLLWQDWLRDSAWVRPGATGRAGRGDAVALP